MPVGDQDHGGVAMTPAVAPGGGHKLLDLSLRQVLAGAQVAIGASPGRNCSFYDSWRDQPEMPFRHDLALPARRTGRIRPLFRTVPTNCQRRFYRPAPLSTAMSSWQTDTAERNRRSLARLSKALPPIFPPVVLARALARPF